MPRICITLCLFFGVNSAILAQNTLPEFNGGQELLFQFVAQNLNYPVKSKENCEQGTVLVRFCIQADGKIDSLEVKNAVDSLLAAEAMRLVRLTDAQWIPAMVEGAAVRSFFTLPVAFVLNDGKCPTQADFYNQAADLLDEKKFQAALEAINKAIAINPFGKYYYQIRGKAKLGLGDAQAACDDFKYSVMLGNALAQALVTQNCP